MQEIATPAGAVETPPARGRNGLRGVDVGVALLLAAAAATAAWVVTGLLGHITLLSGPKADDVWFEADVGRVFDNMTARFSNHYRSQVHPLFSLVALGLVQLCGRLARLGKLDAVRLALASAAALWTMLFFGLLRALQCRRLDAAVFCTVAATSAAAMFWAAVPETYLFSSASIVFAMAITAAAERRRIPAWLDVGMAAASLSMLVTNFMFGLISLAVRHRLKVAAQLAANGLVVVVILWTVQKYIAPSAHFFLGDHEGVAHVEALSVPKIFFLDTLVMPDVRSIANDHPWLWPKLSVQYSHDWAATPAGAAALGAWLLLFGAGTWAALTLGKLQKFRAFLGLALAGQLALHMIYGNESFLYAMNWLPLLVTVAALATLTKLRWVSLAAAMVYIASAAIHNYAQLRFALDLVASRSP